MPPSTVHSYLSALSSELLPTVCLAQKKMKREKRASARIAARQLHAFGPQCAPSAGRTFSCGLQPATRTFSPTNLRRPTAAFGPTNLRLDQLRASAHNADLWPAGPSVQLLQASAHNARGQLWSNSQLWPRERGSLGTPILQKMFSPSKSVYLPILFTYLW